MGESSLYFISSDYYKLWSKKVREKGTVRTSPLPIPLAPYLGSTILEIGVGEGRILRRVMKCLRPRIYIGLDISARILAYVKTGALKGYYIELIQADARYLPLRGSSLMTILCIATSQYIPDKIGLFREVLRVLREHGFFLCTFFNSRSLKNILNGLLRRLMSTLVRHGFLRTFIWWLGYCLIKAWRGRIQCGLDIEWLESMLKHGAPPFYPIRRSSYIRLLINAGFNKLIEMTLRREAFIVIATK